MAKLTGPLFSLDAHGSIDNALTYSKRKSGSQVRFQHKQKVEVTNYPQANNQSMYRLAYARWLSLTDAQRETYDHLATEKKGPLSGWNLFLKLSMADPLTYLGLMLYLSFNQTGLGTVPDLSKNGNITTLKPSWPSNAPGYIKGKNTKLLNAISFDGVDDYITTGGVNSFQFDNTLSIEFWVKVNGAPALRKGVIGNGGTVPTTWIGWNFHILSGENTIILWITGTGDFVARHSTTIITNNVWHHIAGVLDKTTGMKLYIDGVLEASAAIPAGDYTSNLGTTIGSVSLAQISTYNLLGSIDEVRIYNRILPATEVKDLYELFK